MNQGEWGAGIHRDADRIWSCHQIVYCKVFYTCRLRLGEVSAMLPVLEHIFLHFSRYVHDEISESGHQVDELSNLHYWVEYPMRMCCGVCKREGMITNCTCGSFLCQARFWHGHIEFSDPCKILWWYMQLRGKSEVRYMELVLKISRENFGLKPGLILTQLMDRVGSCSISSMCHALAPARQLQAGLPNSW